MLAFLPEERAAEVVRRTRFERFTHRTIATPEALRTGDGEDTPPRLRGR